MPARAFGYDSGMSANALVARIAGTVVALAVTYGIYYVVDDATFMVSTPENFHIVHMMVAMSGIIVAAVIVFLIWFRWEKL